MMEHILKTMIKLLKILLIIAVSFIAILIYIALVEPRYLYLLDGNTRKVMSLSKAIREGNVERVRKIAKYGKEITDSYVDYGSTPLLIATGYNRDECVEILLKNGANPDRYNLTYKRSPLHLAAENNNVNIAKLLIRYGADVNITADILSANTPLQIAAIHDSSNVIAVLLDNGANINIRNSYSNGMTPLHFAVENDALSSIKVLLAKGAKRNIKDDEGNLPIDLALTEKVRQLLKGNKSNNILRK